MPKTYDNDWAEKQLEAHPPGRYKLTLAEVGGIIEYTDDTCFAMTACCNYGFRRGRNYERNMARGKRGGEG